MDEEGLMAILNEDMERNPLTVRALCCSLGGDWLDNGDGELFAFGTALESAVSPLVVNTD